MGELITVSAAAARFGFSPRCIKRWCDKRVIPSIVEHKRGGGRHRLLDPEDVVNWLLRRTSRQKRLHRVYGPPAVTMCPSKDISCAECGQCRGYYEEAGAAAIGQVQACCSSEDRIHRGRQVRY